MIWKGKYGAFFNSYSDKKVNITLAINKNLKYQYCRWILTGEGREEAVNFKKKKCGQIFKAFYWNITEQVTVAYAF